MDAFRVQLRQLLINLSNVWRLPYDDTLFTWDESQESVVPNQIEYLTQLSDQEEFAFAFQPSTQQDYNELLTDTILSVNDNETPTVEQPQTSSTVQPLEQGNKINNTIEQSASGMVHDRTEENLRAQPSRQEGNNIANQPVKVAEASAQIAPQLEVENLPSKSKKRTPTEKPTKTADLNKKIHLLVKP